MRRKEEKNNKVVYPFSFVFPHRFAPPILRLRSSTSGYISLEYLIHKITGDRYSSRGDSETRMNAA